MKKFYEISKYEKIEVLKIAIKYVKEGFGMCYSINIGLRAYYIRIQQREDAKEIERKLNKIRKRLFPNFTYENFSNFCKEHNFNNVNPLKNTSQKSYYSHHYWYIKNEKHLNESINVRLAFLNHLIDEIRDEVRKELYSK